MTRTASLPHSPAHKVAKEAAHPAIVRPRLVAVILAVLYYACAITASYNIIAHAKASTDAIERVLNTYNMKNEGSLALDRYAHEHPLLGIFMSSPARHELGLPTHDDAEEQLTSGVSHDFDTVRAESHNAAWWSWAFLSLSFLYVVITLAIDRSFRARSALFAMTSTSLFCFIIGILAPAMIIWTAPEIPLETGKLSFVLQHEIRGIWAIIYELFTKGHWIIGGFLFVFSIVTPLTKATLTFVVTASGNRKLNLWIGQFIHTVGKWSMADVFVAAILLALYALKFQEATKSVPCLGLYYFIGYCLLSLTTTELLVNSEIATERRQSYGELGLQLVAGLFVACFCFASAAGIYTYQQYTANEKQSIHAPTSPEKLNSANLVLPAHQKAP
jgi:paraquat-inducible protein A